MPLSRNPSRSAAVALLAVAAVVLAAVWWLGRTTDDVGQATARPTVPSTAAASVDPASGLPVVRVADLPPEARDTLALIDAGGPFPSDRDGAVFQNRERLLPAQARGWYHEYTVPTPGETDRGARRIVTGRDGLAYWSPDHYASFGVIEEDP
ncbi:ribonuclease domain-containing protein [Phycicoccus sonneratiae]|uniref:Uncharacterized protein n=1 Tax=Phycicoccus sonneratiae TaxID=2807628 RepID=A0ABS2CRU7_9MICO|nr:ribonuclease domain-containing protein [Phycicoccus sonneraticus]MBM6402540.1 hypothetical protein [Phycicoccus sonneraticus]